MPRPTPSKRKLSKEEAQAKFDFYVKGAQASKVGSSRMGELALSEDKREGRRRAAEIILKYGGGRKGKPKIA